MALSRAARPVRPRKVRTAILIALVPGLMGVLFARWPVTENLERSGLDALFILRRERPAPERVCVVAIDDDSYKVLEVPMAGAWPRALHAQLVRTLKREGARAVAFDIRFEEARDPVQDAALESALAETGIVVLGASYEQVEDPRFTQARLIEPYTPFAAAAADVGVVNLPTDRDGVIRYAWPVLDGRPSLSLAAYELATGDTASHETGGRLIDYYGGPRHVRTVSVYQALDPAQYLPPGFFRDKIVFVGLSEAAASGQAAKDAYFTPFRGGAGQTTFGVEIHATIAGNLLEGRHIDLLPAWAENLLLLLLPLSAALIFMYLGPVPGGFAFLGLELLPWVTAYFAFGQFRLWLPVVIPSAIQLPVAYGMSLIWYYLTTRRERERIRRAFSFYLSPEMIEKITANPDALNLGGEEIVATAVFTDIKGFTTIAEGMPAQETAAMLNTYFTGITAAIFETGGTLIKYIGDAVFAIWGAPLRMDDHATKACLTALAMARTQGLSEDPTSRTLVTRIGVHTGSMLVGNLGSSQRFDYTAIGDSVNLAARLEGLNKAFGTTVLASGDALAATDGRFVTRPLGLGRVVGRHEPVELHELVGVKGEELHPGEAALDAFRRGLDHFIAARFDEAERLFRETQQLCGGNDGPAEFYLKTIEKVSAEPLPSAWDGVITFESK